MNISISLNDITVFLHTYGLLYDVSILAPGGGSHSLFHYISLYMDIMQKMVRLNELKD